MPDKIPIENMLIDRGYLTRGQLDRAMRLKEGRPSSASLYIFSPNVCFK